MAIYSDWQFLKKNTIQTFEIEESSLGFSLTLHEFLPGKLLVEKQIISVLFLKSISFCVIMIILVWGQHKWCICLMLSALPRVLRSGKTFTRFQIIVTFLLGGGKGCFLFETGSVYVVWNLLCRSEWYQTHRDHCASVSQMLTLKACTIVPSYGPFF